MSRSYYHSNFIGFTKNADSEKRDKRIANRKLRRKVHCGAFDLLLRDVSDPWTMEKDGKTYFYADEMKSINGRRVSNGRRMK